MPTKQKPKRKFIPIGSCVTGVRTSMLDDMPEREFAIVGGDLFTADEMQRIDFGERPVAKPPARPKPKNKAKATSEKRERVQQLIRKFSAMTEDERTAAVAGRLIRNVEGHALSAGNTFLLLSQLPSVSLVGGFRQWLKQDRCVRNGERGLLIATPRTKTTDADSDDEARSVYFRTASVFDISQTDELSEE